MAVTAAVFAQVFESAFGKEMDILADTIKVLLTTNTYAPDLDTHQYKDVSVTNEVTGTGYTAGGVTLSSGKVFSYTAGTNTWMFDADNAQWTTSTITARKAVIYDDTPASNKPLISYQNFGADFVSTGGTFEIQWNASGIFTIVIGAEA